MKKKLMKSLFMLAMLLFFTVGVPRNEAFASCSYPYVSTNAYLELAAFRNVDVYTGSSLSIRGTYSPWKKYNAYISRGDVVYVYTITSNYCFLSYPVGKIRKLAYCKTSDLLGLAQANACITAKAGCTVYKTSTGGSYGSISKNDRVYTMVKMNNRGFVIYTAKSGKRAWKAGWISLNDVTKIRGTATSSSTNTSSALRKNLSTALYNSSSAYISCGFDGYKSTSGRHEGIDIKYKNGASVFSLTDGIIVRVVYGSNGSRGLSTIAIYNAAKNKTIIYLHTAPVYGLRAGQTIRKGQKIATESWRGISSSSSAHTHVEVRNGKKGYAAKSVKDPVLDNSNPTSFWNSMGYNVR